jgi:invasion protein IalB
MQKWPIRSAAGIAVAAAVLGATAGAQAAPEGRAVQLAQAEGYEANHRDWAVRCGACLYPEDHLCSAWAMVPDPAGERDLSLVFYLSEPGRKPQLALDVPVIGAGPVRLTVDDEPPMTLAPPEVQFWAMTGELGIESEYTTDQLIEAFRRGRTVTVTFSDTEFVTRTPAFSLLGFGAALDDMVARVPANPPFCED